MPRAYQDPVLKFETNLRVFLGATMSYTTGNGYFIGNEILKNSMVSKGQTLLASTVSEYTGWDFIQIDNALRIAFNTAPYFIAHGFRLLSFPWALAFAAGSVVWSFYATEGDVMLNIIPNLVNFSFASNKAVKGLVVINSAHIIYEHTTYKYELEIIEDDENFLDDYDG